MNVVDYKEKRRLRGKGTRKAGCRKVSEKEKRE